MFILISLGGPVLSERPAVREFRCSGTEGPKLVGVRYKTYMLIQTDDGPFPHSTASYGNNSLESDIQAHIAGV